MIVTGSPVWYDPILLINETNISNDDMAFRSRVAAVAAAGFLILLTVVTINPTSAKVILLKLK